ncbi:MAG: hypothetical protein MJ198_03275 [Bacteroidales bacterium]|nr:hypothetical protein [Bacteroidales bacterium]
MQKSIFEKGMVIHNEKYASKKKIWKTFGVVLITTICVYIPLSANFLREFGVEIKQPGALTCLLLISAVLAIYAAIIYLQHRKKLNFIYISDEDKQNIVFRFYHIQLLMAKCTSYKIPFDAFKKYEITKEGKDNYLVLYQKMGKNQLAKYPPISINSLKDEEIQQVKDLLDQYC